MYLRWHLPLRPAALYGSRMSSERLKSWGHFAHTLAHSPHRGHSATPPSKSSASLCPCPSSVLHSFQKLCRAHQKVRAQGSHIYIACHTAVQYPVKRTKEGTMAHAMAPMREHGCERSCTAVACRCSCLGPLVHLRCFFRGPSTIKCPNAVRGLSPPIWQLQRPWEDVEG